MEQMNLILGNGLTGKIFAFYNREYKILGKNTTMSQDSILSNMIFLQDNYYNRMFLQDLISISKMDICYNYKNIDVLSFKSGQYTADMSEDDKLKIINKKLTSVIGEKLDFKSSVFQDKLTLSEEKNNILRIIEVNFEDIMTALDVVVAEQTIDESFILSINPSDKTVTTEKEKYFYKDLVVTFNLNTFKQLSGDTTDKLKSLDAYIVEGTEETFGVPRIPYADAIVYYPDEKYEFGKIVKRNNRCFAEITGQSTIFKGGVLNKTARLIKLNSTNNYKNIIFLGRFAEWNPDTRIQDVVRKASSKTIMQNIWADQKAFSSRFFDMSEDLTLIQKNIKEISLLMTNETFDLLNNINWKLHNAEKKLDLEKIKEEWIDIYKFWLSIGLNLGLTYEDFIDAYNKKSKKLQEKYK